MIPGLAALAGIAGNPAITVEYGGSAADAPPFSQSMAIGTAAANRRIVVCAVSTATSAVFGSCTVAGQSCTLLASLYLGGFINVGIYITDAPVTSGTTATVAWNTADSTGTAGIAFTYAVYGARATAFDSETSFAENPSVSIDVALGGAVIALSGVLNASDACTWTNATEGAQQTSTSVEASVASYTSDVAVAGRTITAAWAVGAADTLVAISLQPE